MTTKDYVYLSLLALTAVAFYWTGFYGGFNTTLKMLQEKENLGTADSDFELKTGVEAPKESVPMTTMMPPVRETAPASGVHFPIRDSLFGRN